MSHNTNTVARVGSLLSVKVNFATSVFIDRFLDIEGIS